MNKLLLVIIFLSLNAVNSQVDYRTVKSKKLQAERQVKIQLPRGYKSDTTQVYPVFIVLDGDYLFEPVAGMTDYYSYWDDMPKSIVVGINHNDKRKADTKIDSKRGLPTETGADFFEFVGSELLPLIDQNYRTSEFDVIVGHDKTANFINYYLFKDKPLFQAYINLSPQYADRMPKRIADNLRQSKKEFWYYLATAENDVKSLEEKIESTKEKLENENNPNLHFRFDNYEDADHYALAGLAIPRAIQSVFSTYSPITEAEYRDELLETEDSYVDYLEDKYETIQELYHLDKTISADDFMKVSEAIKEKEKWNQYRDLARLAEDEHPKTVLSNYFWGRYYAETGSPADAVDEYQDGFSKDKISFIDRDYLLDLAEDLKHQTGK